MAIFTAGFFKYQSFPSAPSPELIAGPEQTPSSEQIATPESPPVLELPPTPKPPLAPEASPEPKTISVGTVTSANKMESAQSWDFQLSRLPEDQNLWTFLGQLSSSLIEALISVMVNYIINYICGWCWGSEGRTEQEPSVVRILLHEGTVIISKMKTALDLLKDEEGHHLAQFHDHDEVQ
jgi:hypothetical protein